MKTTDYYFHQKAEEIATKYGLGAHTIHESIIEFFEGEDLPLFQLIFGPSDKSDGENVIVVTFHLELDPVDAIQWFHRVRNLIPDIRLQASYYKDDRGESFLGELAHQIRIYKQEQKVLSEFIQSKKDDEDVDSYLKGRAFGRYREKGRAFNEVDKALAEFNRYLIPDDEIQ